MKTLFLLIAISFSIAINAQVTKVSLQAGGLTCSMCSNAINKALKTIDFVDKVNPDIETSSFDITFKRGSHVDFDKLKKKVEDAGFFVSKFIASVQFDKVQVKENEPVTIGDKTFQFVNVKPRELNGVKPVKILDKGFVSSKEYKKNAFTPSSNDARVYHVTI